MYFLVVNGLVQFSVMQWWPSFYVRMHGLDPSAVGMYLGLALGIGSGVGTLVGGLLANKAARYDAKLPLIVCAVATVLSLPAICGSLLVPSATGSIILASLSGLLGHSRWPGRGDSVQRYETVNAGYGWSGIDLLHLRSGFWFGYILGWNL